MHGSSKPIRNAARFPPTDLVTDLYMCNVYSERESYVQIDFFPASQLMEDELGGPISFILPFHLTCDIFYRCTEKRLPEADTDLPFHHQTC